MKLEALLARGGPFIDLRSPKEFNAGAVPGATSLPLLSNEERHQIGLCYKAEGQAAAIALGERLVAGTVRRERTDAWLAFAAAHPESWLYCWRGGLRSETVARWLAAEGVTLPRVPGGFKALRQCCLDVLDRAPGGKPWLVLGGRTGTGKTRVLHQITGAIDLEGLANHRGSAFGGALTPQPTPIAFENALAVATLQHRAPVVILEDESRTIGRLGLPSAWHGAMQETPLVLLEAPLAVRSAHIASEYVWEPLAAGLAASTLHTRLQSALDRIRRRLGGQRHKAISSALGEGFSTGDHAPWIDALLTGYYDPMYDYQLEGKAERVIFRGEADAVIEFLEAYQQERTGAVNREC